MPPRVSIVVPVYNEEASIESVLRKVCVVPVDKEIIVVDDGSTDSTGAILDRLRAELPIRVVTHPQNRGKGRAIQFGLAQSRGEVIRLQDADFECDPGECPALLKPILEGQATVVYGSRFLGRRWTEWSWHWGMNWVITTLVNVLFGVSLTDVETGNKVFRREVAEAMSLRSEGFDFEVEFTCKVLRGKHRIVEVPVPYVRRGYAEGKKVTWKDGFSALWVIVRCRLNPNY